MRRKHHPIIRFWAWGILFWFIVWLITYFATYNPATYQLNTVAGVALGIFCGWVLVPITILVIWGGMRAGKMFANSVMVAATPLPTLDEVAVYLEGQFGRPPTLQEVELAYNWLKDRRNQHLYQAAGLGALTWWGTFGR